MYKRDTERIFPHPFCREYWILAFRELKDVRMLILAAVVIAARTAVGMVNPLQITPDLKINLSFWFVAAGCMIYGPVVGALSGAVSDTVSCAIRGFEGYFFPYIFVEMLGGFLYGIILYRRRLSTGRVILARAAVNVGCNLIANPLVRVLQYRLLNVGSAYTLYNLALTLFKNVLLLPFESLILVLFISAMIPPLKALGCISKAQPKIYLKKSHYIILGVLLACGIGLLALLLYTGFFDWVKNLLKAWLG